MKTWYVYSRGGGYIGTVTAKTKAAAVRKAREKWGRSSDLSDADLRGITVRSNPAGRSNNPRAGVKLPRTGHTGFLKAKAVDVITRGGRVVEVRVKR